MKLKYIALIALAAASCGNKNRDAATELLNQAEQAVNDHNYYGAIELLDTLNARHRDQIEQRRSGILLRARAMEGIAIDSISDVDAQLAAATLACDSMAPLFKHIPAPAAGMDGYWLPANASTSLMTATGLRARVNEDGYLQLDVNVHGRVIGLNGIRLVAGADSWTSGTVSAAALVSGGGNESITLRQEQLSDLGYWLATHPGAITVKYCGSRGETSAAMTSAIREELLAASRYAYALQAKRSALIRRERYERMLATARDQIANLTPAQ